mmetsp:Transcript_917/g.1128  ORF Transcript_917/g.1128 Transcript_917/m.1128 type:complete len:303 (+) Transcript_917:3-911(+)
MAHRFQYNPNKVRMLSSIVIGPRKTATAKRLLAAAVSTSRSLSTRLAEPELDIGDLQHRFQSMAPQMAQALQEQGYYTKTEFLDSAMIQLLRNQSISLRDQGRFEPSWSETIVNGRTTRFDKPGVHACEPDGRDYDSAPDLIVYMSGLLQALPSALNPLLTTSTVDIDLSNAQFNAKLAVTLPGGSVYPLHIDNAEGLAVGDTRKLTCILYLNPSHEPQNGGELQIVLDDSTTVDLPPSGGRLVAFWSDEIPHQVLPMAPHADAKDISLDRYALTIWIPTGNAAVIHNPSSKFRALADIAFP